MADDRNCKICGRPANLQHVLFTCSVDLLGVRYTWRLDTSDTLDKLRKKSRRNRAGELSAGGGGVKGSGLLGKSSDQPETILSPSKQVILVALIVL
jgi:hypothetical protein